MKKDNLVEANFDKPTVRFLACGHVDDGKSTLIGRLLYEIGAVPDDQIQAASASGKMDFARITDGLEDELSQGITIDVAYRYFRHAGRYYIMADTPGHMQYTRNMAVAASTVDYAITLIDSSHGVREQTIRHSRIVTFFGVRHIIVAISKMDLVGYSEEKFEEIKKDYLKALPEIDPSHFTFIPVSALAGDNIADRSANMPWYSGPTVLDKLKSLDVPVKVPDEIRLPVQYMVKTPEGKRGYQGRLSGKELKVGDKLLAIDTSRTVDVTNIYHSGHEVQKAEHGQSITVVVAQEEDISRGTVLAGTTSNPTFTDAMNARILWMGDGYAGTTSWQGILKVHHHETEAQVIIDENSSGILVDAEIETASQLAADLYKDNRHTGLFLLIEPETEKVAAVGAVTGFFKQDSSWQI